MLLENGALPVSSIPVVRIRLITLILPLTPIKKDWYLSFDLWMFSPSNSYRTQICQAWVCTILWYLHLSARSLSVPLLHCIRSRFWLVIPSGAHFVATAGKRTDPLSFSFLASPNWIVVWASTESISKSVESEWVSQVAQNEIFNDIIALICYTWISAKIGRSVIPKIMSFVVRIDFRYGDWYISCTCKGYNVGVVLAEVVDGCRCVIGLLLLLISRSSVLMSPWNW